MFFGRDGLRISHLMEVLKGYEWKMYTFVVLLSCVCALQIFLVYTPLGCICKLESILYCHLRHRHTTVKLLFDSHSSQTTLERAEGADEGPERSQARTKQRKPSQKVILLCLQHERLSTEVSRDTSRDMAGEVGRDPLLQRVSFHEVAEVARESQEPF